jgi:16S rRNA G966 N2-methylase RsmD
MSKKVRGSPQSSPLSVSKGVRFRIDESGSLRASVSQSSGEFELSLEIIQLLALIQKRAHPSVLAQRLRSDLNNVCAHLPEQTEINQLIDDLKQAQCLSNSDGLESGTGIKDGFGDEWIQWAMLADEPRCKSYERAIRSALSRNAVVVDIGAGSGLLSLFSLHAGARHVTAIEETGIATSLRKLKKRLPIELQEKFEIQNCNSCDSKIPENTSHIVSELFGNDPFQEGVIPTLRDFFSRLRSNSCVAIPESCVIFVQLADIVAGPLAQRIERFAEHPKTSNDSWRTSIEQIKSTLSFNDTSFAHTMRVEDTRHATPLELCFSVSLSPPPSASAKRPKHSCVLTPKVGMSAPAVLLFFRAQLFKEESVSNITGAHDCCEHWSPIVIPLNRAIQPGEEIRCAVSLSEDWCRTIATVTSKSQELLGSRQ